MMKSYSTRSVQVTLDWHHTRRSQGLPTLSVLVGRNPIGLREWRAWCARHRRAIIAETTLARAASDWLRNLSDLGNRVQDWLIAKTREVDGIERPDFARMTPYDLDRLWCAASISKDDPVPALAYRVVRASIRTHPLDCDGVVREVGDATVLAALCGLIPETSWPAVLLIHATDPDPAEYLLRSLRDFERLAMLVPQFSVGACVTAASFESTLAQGTRTVALAREGEVQLTGVSFDELTDRLQKAGVPEPFPTSAIRRLTTEGLAEDVAGSYVEAAVAIQRAARESPKPDDGPHRSASERFLFAQLESMVETAGLFAPNRDLEFLHGTKLAEADLVAPELKLAIEIDGGYYHLNAEQYRRDRRKDHAYQRHGYWVLRFLAEDVVVDLEAILNTILEAVASRRSAPRTEVYP